MSVDERHRRLYRRLEQVLGTEEAGTLIDDLSQRTVTPELLRSELHVVSNSAMVFAVAGLAFGAARLA